MASTAFNLTGQAIAPAGTLVKLSSTAFTTTTAAVFFTLSGSYSSYIINYNNLSTTGTSFALLAYVSSNGGSTYLSSIGYSITATNSETSFGSAQTAMPIAGIPGSTLVLYGTGSGLGTIRGSLGGTMQIFTLNNIGSSTCGPIIANSSYNNASGNLVGSFASGNWTNGTYGLPLVNYIKIAPSVQNFECGSFELYGVV